MKKSLTYIVPVLVFAAAMAGLKGQQEDQVLVAVAAYDMPAGHVLDAADLKLEERPESIVSEGAFADPVLLVGETLSVPRSGGDLILRSNLGGETVPLEVDERKVAIEVNNAGGLAGLLKVGDLVGVTAVLRTSEGTYSKVVAEGLRVLAISPEFQAIDPMAYQSDPLAVSEEGSNMDSFGAPAPTRDETGVVSLAVPIYAQVVAYDFERFGVGTDAVMVNLLELLPALDHTSDVEFSLFLVPKGAVAFSTSGLFVPDLVRTPGPSPTPTVTPYGYDPAAETETPAATLEATPTP